MPYQQFNTHQYSWAEVDIQINGRMLIGVRGLSYSASQEKEYIYGKGEMPQSIGRGNVANRGELILSQNELETLIQGAPNGNLLAYRNMDIQVAYRQENGQVISDSLVGVEFSDVEKALRQNDKSMEVTLPIMFLKVNHNI